MDDSVRSYVHCRAGWQRSASVAAGAIAVFQRRRHRRRRLLGSLHKSTANPLPHQRVGPARLVVHPRPSAGRGAFDRRSTRGRSHRPRRCRRHRPSRHRPGRRRRGPSRRHGRDHRCRRGRRSARSGARRAPRPRGLSQTPLTPRPAASWPRPRRWPPPSRRAPAATPPTAPAAPKAPRARAPASPRTRPRRHDRRTAAPWQHGAS